MKKFNTNFHNNKIPKEGSQFISLSAISIDSVFRTCQLSTVFKIMKICC